MNHRNPLSPFAHKTQVLMRAFSPRSPALRAALTGTTLGLAALAFAPPRYGPPGPLFGPGGPN